MKRSASPKTCAVCLKKVLQFQGYFWRGKDMINEKKRFSKDVCNVSKKRYYSFNVTSGEARI